jgi:hypothetical protein
MPVAGELRADDAAMSAAMKDVRPNDIDPKWMDEMVKRLFNELRKQLSRIEATKPEDNDTKNASVRVANVRALDTIERTLERLARMEKQRVESRESKQAQRNDAIRAELHRRINNLLTFEGKDAIPGGDEQ